MNRTRQDTDRQGDYWSMSYRGQHIAVQRHYRGWLVYLNHAMQHNLVFIDARSAANWLRRTVDQHVVIGG